MNISPELFKKLIDATETSFFDYFLQIMGIVVPLIFAVWISRLESKKLKQEEGSKNRILDQRQQKLEKIQDSIKCSIEELTTKHNELVDTQKAVEQNLTELKILSAQSRQANILTLQSVYREFFDKYKEFEAAINKLERLRPKFVKGESQTDEEIKELLTVYEEIEHPKIRYLESESIPLLVFEEYQQLKEILWENTLKDKGMIGDIFDSKYDELLTVFEEFRKKLYYDI